MRYHDIVRLKNNQPKLSATVRPLAMFYSKSANRYILARSVIVVDGLGLVNSENGLIGPEFLFPDTMLTVL